MANTFGKQTLVAKEAFFQFSQTGKISQNIDWRSDDFSPSENIGGAKTYRRPARVETSSRGVLTDGSVPVGAQTLTSFTEPLVTLTVGRAFEANLGISLDDATFALSKEQVVSRHLAPAARKLRNQIDTYIGNLALLYSGNVVGNPASPSTGTAARDAFASAQELLNSRGREDDGDSVAIVSEKLSTQLTVGQLSLFNPTKAVEKLYRQGMMGQFAGFDFYRSPLLPSDRVTATGTVTVNGANQSAGAIWTPTWSLITAGWTSPTVPAGTKIRLANSGTAINWVHPDTFVDTGIQATFTVVSTATVTGGAATLTLSEPLIGPGGSPNAYQNVTAIPANGATIAIVSSATAPQASLVFDRKAIIGASPKIALPKNLDFQAQENINGINVAIIESHDPYTLSKIHIMKAYVGAVVYLPEFVASVY